jgi:hypothetical protein
MVITSGMLAAQLELAESLRAERDTMLKPQELPGRYGRVIAALDHLLQVIGCEGVVAGGWAVWRHGYLGRVTQDVDIVVPAGAIEELLRVAPAGGFDVVEGQLGMWPKLRHKETDITVDLLPEGATPGTPKRPAPTTIPHPSQMGARGTVLEYIDLPSLVELKLAAGRARDESDIVELIRVNPEQVDQIRQHLGRVHDAYATRFDALVERAEEQADH